MALQQLFLLPGAAGDLEQREAGGQVNEAVQGGGGDLRMEPAAGRDAASHTGHSRRSRPGGIAGGVAVDDWSD